MFYHQTNLFRVFRFAIFADNNSKFPEIYLKQMKKFARAAAFLILTAALSVSVFAQSQKDEQFNKIAKLTQSKKDDDREKAYQMGKEFVNKFGKDGKDEMVVKIKSFVDTYRLDLFNKKLDETKTAEAFALGKEILASEPENSYVTMNLAYAGLDALQKKKDSAFAADSIAYAKQTLSLLEAGKAPKIFQPFAGQTEVTAVMYYVIGNFQFDGDSKQAAQNFYKAVGYDSKIKSDAFAYYAIAAFYEKEYARQSAEAKADYDAKKVSDEQLAVVQEKLGRLLGNMLDAYARAIKYGEAQKNADVPAWKARFTAVYNFLKKSDAGLNDYLANQPNTALPDPNAL